MNYMTNEDKRNEELIKSARDSILRMGFGRAMTEEEIEKRNKKMRRSRKRNAIMSSIMSCVRTAVYTPLSIAFHAISFVSKGAGCISAFGMLVGVYYVYMGISAVVNGAAFGEIDSFQKAVPYFIFPFIAYGTSVVTERIYHYLEDNAF